VISIAGLDQACYTPSFEAFIRLLERSRLLEPPSDNRYHDRRLSSTGVMSLVFHNKYGIRSFQLIGSNIFPHIG